MALETRTRAARKPAEFRARVPVGELLMCDRMRAIVVIGLTLVGCAYQPGSFQSPMQSFVGQLASIDCLDLAIERRPDLPAGDAVVSYAFGNRCDHPVIVDLAMADLFGRTSDGQQLALSAYDPFHELSIARLDGRAVGREAISYQSDVPLRDICVDAASIAHAAPSVWLCLAARPQPSEAQ